MKFSAVKPVPPVAVRCRTTELPATTESAEICSASMIGLGVYFPTARATPSSVVVVATEIDVAVPIAALAGATDRTPAPNAATATSAMRL